MDAISLKKKYFLVFLLVSLMAMARAEPLSKWEIHIKNGLSKGQALVVHCKSKDSDLGVQTLGRGSEFKWNFKVNIWDTTLFWCYLQKPNGFHVTFDAFWVEKKTVWLRAQCQGNICYWTADDNAIYLNGEFVHHWKYPAKN